MIRKQILLEPRHNERLKALRADTGMSESELMRRALDAFSPGLQVTSRRSVESPGAPPDDALLAAFARQNERTAAALERAAVELDRTLARLAGQPGAMEDSQ